MTSEDREARMRMLLGSSLLASGSVDDLYPPQVRKVIEFMVGWLRSSYPDAAEFLKLAQADSDWPCGTCDECLRGRKHNCLLLVADEPRPWDLCNHVSRSALPLFPDEEPPVTKCNDCGVVMRGAVVLGVPIEASVHPRSTSE